MEKFDAPHGTPERDAVKDALNDLIASLEADLPQEGTEAPFESDLTEEETRALAAKLAGISVAITETLGYFDTPLTYDTFMEAFEIDLAKFQAEPDIDQPNRYLIATIWESMGEATSNIFLVSMLNKEQAIDATKKAFPDREVDNEYIDNALTVISDALNEASKLAKHVASSRGERSL